MHQAIRGASGVGAMLTAGMSLAVGTPRLMALPPTRVVAVSGAGGTTVPGVAGAQFSVIGAAQIDASGGVIATCRFSGAGVAYGTDDLGLFSFDRLGVGRLLARTSAASGVSAATFSSSFYPRLRDDGGVAAVCFLDGAGVDATNNTGYWMGTRASIAPTLRSGVGSVPGVPGASFFGFAGGFPCAVGGNGMAFVGQMAVGVAGVAIDTYQGLWGTGMSGSLMLLARTGVALGVGSPPGVPGPLGASYSQLNSRSLTMAGNGRIAFNAGLTAGLGAAGGTVVVERRPDGTMVIAARQGDAAPGWPGLTFFSLETSAQVMSGGVSINSAGDLAFADVDADNPPATGVSRVWRRRASGVFDLGAATGVASGAGAPVGIAGVFTTLKAPAIDAGGRMVFAGTVQTPGGGSAAGMWILNAGASAAQLIARSDLPGTAQSPPGIAAARFSAGLPDIYRMNSRGQMIFHWKLEDGPGGVSAANDDGLWAYDPALGLMSVVRSGDVVQVGGVNAVVKSISSFSGPGGGDDGRIRDLNDSGEAAYCVQFTDASGGGWRGCERGAAGFAVAGQRGVLPRRNVLGDREQSLRRDQHEVCRIGNELHGRGGFGGHGDMLRRGLQPIRERDGAGSLRVLHGVVRAGSQRGCRRRRGRECQRRVRVSDGVVWRVLRWLERLTRAAPNTIFAWCMRSRTGGLCRSALIRPNCWG